MKLEEQSRRRGREEGTVARARDWARLGCLEGRGETATRRDDTHGSFHRHAQPSAPSSNQLLLLLLPFDLLRIPASSPSFSLPFPGSPPFFLLPTFIYSFLSHLAPTTPSTRTPFPTLICFLPLLSPTIFSHHIPPTRSDLLGLGGPWRPQIHRES